MAAGWRILPRINYLYSDSNSMSKWSSSLVVPSGSAKITTRSNHFFNLPAYDLRPSLCVDASEPAQESGPPSSARRRAGNFLMHGMVWQLTWGGRVFHGAMPGPVAAATAATAEVAGTAAIIGTTGGAATATVTTGVRVVIG